MSDSQKKELFTKIPVDLESYGLDPYAYRVFTHIIRRRNCFASLKNVAALCSMSVRQVQHALKTLEANGMVEKRVRPGKTNIYVSTSLDRWRKPDYSTPIENGNAQDYFNRALLRRERKDFQGALVDLCTSLELYQQELLDAQRRGRTALRKEQDIRDTKNEILRLVRNPKITLSLDREMSDQLEKLGVERNNELANDLDDLDDLPNDQVND
jgi:DNA-binding transcriptional ArsR family regulator